MNQQLLHTTFKTSFIVQIITGIVSVLGMFIKLKDKDKVLKDILLIENLVQLVEAIFYVYIILAFANINKHNITSRRYLDWVITTPIMLISTIMFMIYKKLEQESPNKKITTTEIIHKEKFTLLKIIAYNFLMLFFGYLGETKMLNKVISTFLGFIFFSLSFYEIWKNYANNVKKNKNLFYFLFIVWSFYGVASMFPMLPKNIMYNFLDIVAKNFYGLYIFYEVYKRRV